MHASASLRTVLALACAVTLCSCQAPRPTAPSALAGAPAAGGLHDDAPVPPSPDPALPKTVTINVVATAGAQSFDPNPSIAAVGDSLVWTNNDQFLHHIMLDDGTEVGDIAPGQSSVAVPLVTPTATYHCTIHPSMVGSINVEMMPPNTEPPGPDPYGYPPFYARSARR